MDSWSDEEYFYKLENMLTGSTQFLRQIFVIKWKVETGEEWKDDQNYIQTNFVRHCENVLKKAIPLQKKLLLESCSSGDWDLSLISVVILNFGDGKKYKLQNRAIRQLKDLRNDLAHHKSKRLSKSEFCEKVKLFKESLQILKIRNSEIEKLVRESSLSSSLGDSEQLNLLLKMAENCMKSQDFEGALKKYFEALNLPRLSADNLRSVYEKRAACYLSIQDGQVCNGKPVDQAFLDVEQSLQLGKHSWNALYLKAQCFKVKNNLLEAIRHYEMALAISPAQSQIKHELYSCRLQRSIERGNSRLNNDQLPETANEIFGESTDISGRPLTAKKTLKLYGCENFPTYLGELYYVGFDVPQDYRKAVKYFKQADNEGLAEGTYKLGLCYYHGHGVPQDFSRAVEVFKRSASTNAKKKNKFENVSPLGYNIGVGNSEYLLGKCYELGTGVEKSLDEAVTWYKSAMEHGHGAAASNLGFYYVKGNRLPENEKMAEMCWKQGLNLGDTNAAMFLVDYYCHQLEPEMAWIMMKIAKEMGHSKFLEMSDDEFSRDIFMFEADRHGHEEYVTTFERQYNVDIKGMTFQQRKLRAEEHLDPNSAKMNNSIYSSFNGNPQQIDIKVLLKIDLEGRYGSETTKQLLENVYRIFKLNRLLALQNDISQAYKSSVINLAYECIILDDHLKCFVKNLPKIKTIVAEMFNETFEKINEEEMKIRLCYIGYNLRRSLSSPDDLYTLGILEEGCRRYPENYDYILLLIYCLKSRGLYKSALKYVNEALEKFPEKVILYYVNASILHKSESLGHLKVIDAYILFLDKAPRDHRLVPEAYYEISFVHMEDYFEVEHANDSDFSDDKKLYLIKENFKSGKEAEKDQLPCYQPYAVSETQLSVEGFLAKIEEVRSPNYSSQNSVVIPWVPKSKSVLERKEYLKSPVRKGLILQHRERLKHGNKQNRNDLLLANSVIQERLQQTRAKKMGHLKSIFLQEMNPTKDSIFENRILDLTIIEEPNLLSNLIQLIAEDDNGDTARVYVDAVATNNIDVQKFVPGSSIAVINPYMWVCPIERINGIRINQQKCIIFLKRLNNMCRFCGEENATQKCSICKRSYCSKECQKLDWQLFEHKLICLSDLKNYFTRDTSIAI